MNHDKATPRPWDVSSSTMIVSMSEFKVVGNTLDLGGIGNMGLDEMIANAALICIAVNAWDDPAKLRERIKELEGNDD